MIIGGDFNCYLSPSLDRDPPYKDQSKSGKALQHFLEIFNLLDGWRYMNPNNRNYTFYSPPHFSFSRIDYIFILEHLAPLVEQSGIGSVALSDHAPVTLEMQPLRPAERSFSWKINASLFHDDNFIKFLETQTDLYLEINDCNDSDPRLVWEAYKAYMRGMIISYSSKKKKERTQEQSQIEKKKKKIRGRFS